MYPFFYFYLQRRSTKPEICKFTFTTASPIPNILKFHFFQYRFFIMLFHKFKYQRGSTKYYRTDLSFPETHFYGMKKNLMSSPISGHKRSRFLLFMDKFVIVQAVLNIIEQAEAFARVFFLHKRLKNERAIGYLKIVIFLTTIMEHAPMPITHVCTPLIHTPHLSMQATHELHSTPRTHATHTRIPCKPRLGNMHVCSFLSSTLGPL